MDINEECTHDMIKEQEAFGHGIDRLKHRVWSFWPSRDGNLMKYCDTLILVYYELLNALLKTIIQIQGIRTPRSCKC